MDAESALMRFCFSEIESAVRKLAHRLQRASAIGIYGNDLGNRTLWDEYCFEQNNGPTPELAGAWEQALAPHVGDVISKMPLHVAKILSWHFSSVEQSEPSDAICHALLEQGILDAIAAKASR